MHRILITGASGIGKSNFISYALAKVLTMVDNTLIIVSVPGVYFIIDMNSRQVASVKIIKNSLTLTDYINMLPTNKRLWYFMDEKEHGGYMNWYPRDSVVVLTTSPDEANYNLFKKKRCTFYYMPWPGCWDGKCLASLDKYSEEELQEFDDNIEKVIATELLDIYEKCYSDLDLSACKSRFDIVGPLIRFVFDSTMSSSDCFYEMQEEVCKGALEIYNALQSGNYSMLRMLVKSRRCSSTYLIFTPSTTLIQDNSFTIYPSSDVTLRLLHEQFKKCCNEPLVRILNSEPDEAVAELWGSLYEKYCIDSLGNRIKYLELFSLNLKNSKNKMVAIDQLHNEVQINDASLLQDLKQMNSSETTLLRAKLHYPAIDCIIIVNRAVYFLQITRSINHPINAKKLNFLCETFKTAGFKAIDFVFILPPKQFDVFCTQRLGKTGGGPYQYVPQEYKCLTNIHQWKAKISPLNSVPSTS